MTKDRLRSLSCRELSQIAEQGKISVPNEMNREALISIIFDALEDDRLDREDSCNLAVQVEAKKYSVSQDEEFFLEFSKDVEIKDRYRENSLVLLLRDPVWVFCYWDLEDRILGELDGNPDYSGLILRVTELATEEWTAESSIDWFDIPIQFEDLNRYINLPREDSFFGAELYTQIGEKEQLIVRSNIVRSSRAYVAAVPGEENAVRDHLIRLSGFSTDVGSFPGIAYPLSDTPQRILTGSGERDRR